MELFQVFWDDQKKLFLEFKKEKDEKQIYSPHKIKYLNLQFEISKNLKQDLYSKQPPFIISIKKLYHSNDFLSFSVDLDEFKNGTNLQIKILRLIILLKSGHKIEYRFTEKFNLSDIWVNEDCYFGYNLEDLSATKRFKRTITKERVFEEIQKNNRNTKEKKTLVIEKQKIENVLENESLGEMLRINNDTLKIIANELKNLTTVLKNLSFINPAQNFLPPEPSIIKSNEPAIQRIRRLPSRQGLIQEGSSAKILVIKEMKEKFTKNIEKNNGFNLKDILKPMSENELKKMILNEEELKKKEEIAIKNQIKRLKKEKKKSISLENLKEPK